MNEQLIDELLFRSEASDLDFKSEQYRFRGASDVDKGKLLKDILALANSWRDGPARILIGFREDRPNPAVVVGITEQLDDADLQQFVRAKVRPTLEFHYEELLYRGKTVGVLTVPKQPRAFYASSPLGSVQPNIVYVRRGSSNAEAEPPEIAKMHLADMGKGPAAVAIRLVGDDGANLQDAHTRRFVSFGNEAELPDYATARDEGPFAVGRIVGLARTNSDYWRDLAAFARVSLSHIAFHLEVENSSSFALNDCKLELAIQCLDGQTVELTEDEDLPERPQREGNLLATNFRSLPEVLAKNARGFSIEGKAGARRCVARFRSVLPGEAARTQEMAVLLPAGPGRIELVCKLLASELTAPVVHSRTLVISGTVEHFGIEDLKDPKKRLAPSTANG